MFSFFFLTTTNYTFNYLVVMSQYFMKLGGRAQPTLDFFSSFSFFSFFLSNIHVILPDVISSPVLFQTLKLVSRGICPEHPYAAWIKN